MWHSHFCCSGTVDGVSASRAQISSSEPDVLAGASLDFPQSLQTSVWILPQIRKSALFPHIFHYLPVSFSCSIKSLTPIQIFCAYKHIIVVRCFEGYIHVVQNSTHLYRIGGVLGGEYEECRLLGYGNPAHSSQETLYVSTTEPNRLMPCNIWGFHGGDYEVCHLLGYKNPVRTSQETHYISVTESSRLMLCKIWDFHGGSYEEYVLLGRVALWALLRRNLSPPSSGWKELLR
jgi:hypothetical protein